MPHKITRFGVSLPAHLVESFDQLISELGYKSRSKAIADAVHSFVVERRTQAEGGRFVGRITFIYDHNVGDVTKRLAELQHQNSRIIRASMHAHITLSKCAESMIVAGNYESIQNLFDEISAARGVVSAKLNALVTGD